ncbi:glycosyltransferase [uncultured Rhodoblastus sp.]|uniref:glycosyltransferase n=1 Tax=uncultured Rhodoblastus sp. TaxID=543037 RepID=UPI0025F218B6|nr:glycosyltransferase [uncultured Rhodoblastus sp.]
MHSRQRSLRILHVLRAPVGGLFRHVADLCREQAARGHTVGVIADADTGGEVARRRFDELTPHLSLGVTRLPMRREPHWSDFPATVHVYRQTLDLAPDIVHGHGSKGGLYARALGFLPGAGGAIRVYTPHGGSFHRQQGHGFYMSVERLAAKRTDLVLFESDFIARAFRQGVGPTAALQRVVRNGLRREEFASVKAAPDAADFVYVGELSVFKGVDLLIEAMAQIHAGGKRKPRLVVVGSGAERERLTSLVALYGLAGPVSFAAPREARAAFALGRVVVAPSRRESLPYIVLEAIAAGKTVIATNVGGLPEIFGPLREKLIPPDDVAALALAMIAAIDADPPIEAEQHALLTRHVAGKFALPAMVDAILEAYDEALERRATFKAPAWEAAP